MCAPKNIAREKGSPAGLGKALQQVLHLAMNQPGARDSAGRAPIAAASPGRRLPPGHEPDAGCLAAAWASIQSPVPDDCAGCGDFTAGEVLRITKHLRNVDRKFQNFRELFRKGEVISASAEAKLAELLQAISTFLNTYPALTGDAIQPAVATLIANIDGKCITLGNLTSAVVIALCSVVMESFQPGSAQTRKGVRVHRKHISTEAEQKSVIIKAYLYPDPIVREDGAFKMHKSKIKA